MKKIRILAIDQSLVTSGWSVVDFGLKGFRFRDYGLIRPKKLRGDERLIFIENEVKELIRKFRPNHGVTEGYTYGKKRKTQFLQDAGELGWAIRRTYIISGMKSEVINPKTLKKQITGNGNASKEVVIERAKEISGAKFLRVLQSKVDNVTDAFCLAYIVGMVWRKEQTNVRSRKRRKDRPLC